MRRPASSSGGGVGGERPATTRARARAAARSSRGRSPYRQDSSPSRVEKLRRARGGGRRRARARPAWRGGGRRRPGCGIARSRRPCGDQRAAVRHERVAHEPQLGQQLAGAERSRGPPRARRRRRAARRVFTSFCLDAGELQPVGLLGVQPEEARLHLGQQLQVARERLAQLRRGAGDPLGARQVAPQHVHHRDRVAQRVVVLQAEHAADAVGRHVRVAVAVAADPAAEPERPPLRVRVQRPACGARPPAPPARRAPRRRAGCRSTRRRCAPRPRRRAARSAARPSATAGRWSPRAAPSRAAPPAEPAGRRSGGACRGRSGAPPRSGGR